MPYKKTMKIKDRYIKWDEVTNNTTLITVWDNGRIDSEPLTSEQAAEWHARNGGY